MPQSMTGFANQTIAAGHWKLAIDCKSVNSRFLDITVKIPDVIKRCEPYLRNAINGRLTRGKVELIIRLERDAGLPEAIVNPEKIMHVHEGLKAVKAIISDTTAPSTLDILLAPGVWVAEAADSEDLITHCLQALPTLLDALIAHREAEGMRLESLLRQRCDSITAIIGGYRAQLPALQASHQKKLRDRIDAIGTSHDEKRLEEELAFLANKSDVAEELDRLDAHIEAINDALGSHEPCGRRLDFLMQELNREANTLGAKTTSLTTTTASVELKVLIEQMREQVQNLE